MLTVRALCTVDVFITCQHSIVYHHGQTAASVTWEMKAGFCAMTALVIPMERFFRTKEGGLQRKWASSEIVPVWLEHAQFSLEMWTLTSLTC